MEADGARSSGGSHTLHAVLPLNDMLTSQRIQTLRKCKNTEEPP